MNLTLKEKVFKYDNIFALELALIYDGAEVSRHLDNLEKLLVSYDSIKFLLDDVSPDNIETTIRDSILEQIRVFKGTIKAVDSYTLKSMATEKSVMDYVTGTKSYRGIRPVLKEKFYQSLDLVWLEYIQAKNWDTATISYVLQVFSKIQEYTNLNRGSKVKLFADMLGLSHFDFNEKTLEEFIVLLNSVGN